MHSISGIWKSSSLLVATIVATMLFAVPASADIIVQGARADSETIRSYFTGSSPAEVEKGLEALRASGRFSTVSAARHGKDVVIRVAEGNHINRVVIEGNSKVKTENLQPELRTHAHTRLQSGGGRGGRRAHDGDVSPRRPRRGQGQLSHRRTPQWPDRRRVHRRRGRQDWRQGNPLRRQQRLLQPPPRGPDGDDGDELPLVHQDERRLRSRTASPPTWSSSAVSI